jgi:hypothetical protein
MYQVALFIGESKRYLQKKLWKQASLSIRPPLGNLEGSFAGGSERC